VFLFFLGCGLGCLVGVLGGFWFLFDLCVFVFLLGVGVVCFVVFEHCFFGVFEYVE